MLCVTLALQGLTSWCPFGVMRHHCKGVHHPLTQCRGATEDIVVYLNDSHAVNGPRIEESLNDKSSQPFSQTGCMMIQA